MKTETPFPTSGKHRGKTEKDLVVRRLTFNNWSLIHTFDIFPLEPRKKPSKPALPTYIWCLKPWFMTHSRIPIIIAFRSTFNRETLAAEFREINGFFFWVIFPILFMLKLLTTQRCMFSGIRKKESGYYFVCLCSNMWLLGQMDLFPGT